MNPKKIPFWMAWLLILACAISYRFLLRIESTEKVTETWVALPVLLLVVGSLVCRILIIPKIQKKLFQAYVIGLAMAEFAAVLGIYFLPYYQDLFFTMSVSCILTYLPNFITIPSKR